MTELAARNVQPDATTLVSRSLPTIPRLFSPDGGIWNSPRKWVERGNCAVTDPEALFVSGAQQNEVVKDVCLGGKGGTVCPVKEICLIQALRIGEEFGVQGGFTERQRNVLISGEELVGLQRQAVTGDRRAIEALQKEAVVISMMDRLQASQRPTAEKIAERATRLKEESKEALVSAVLELFMQGLPDQAIANALSIDVRLVGKSLGSLARSHKVNSRVELAIKAKKNGLITGKQAASPDLTIAEVFTINERRVGEEMIADDGRYSSDSSIAEILGMDEETVREHKRSLGKQIGTKTPTGVALFFWELERAEKAAADAMDSASIHVEAAPQKRHEPKPPTETLPPNVVDEITQEGQPSEPRPPEPQVVFSENAEPAIVSEPHPLERMAADPVQERMIGLVPDAALELVAAVYGLFGREPLTVTQIAQKYDISREDVIATVDGAMREFSQHPQIAIYLLQSVSA